MYSISVPASSANLGIGFDCIGMAVNLYDTFTIDRSDHWLLHGFSDDNDIENNLFVHSYNLTSDYLHLKRQMCDVSLEAEIPMSRGLGSSAALILGGICSCNALNGFPLKQEEILKLAISIEGHPDNVTPALLGGLCISRNQTSIRKQISDKYRFGLWIPEYALSTEEARKILPASYPRTDTVENIASALIGIDALIQGTDENISFLMNDRIHEPYRKNLIPDYEIIRDFALKNGALAFLISGSGSTCLSIQKEKLNEISLPRTSVRWTYTDAEICYEGTRLWQKNT